MKKLLLLPILTLLILSSCKEKSDSEPKPNLKPILELKVMKQKKLSSGQIASEAISAIIHIWKAENRDFDVNASPDIHFGYVYDKASESYATMKYGAIGSIMRERIEPGRYFVYVLLPKSSTNSSLAYSYSYFENKEGETLSLTKTFSHDISSGAYKDWDKNN